MQKYIIKFLLLLTLVINFSICFGQTKFKYKDKYKYTVNEVGYLYSLGSTYYITSNNFDYHFTLMKYHNDLFIANIIGLSYTNPKYDGNKPYDLFSIYTGPWGFNKAIFSREKFNILANAGATTKLLLVNTKDFGAKFIFTGELSLTFEAPNVSFDAGYSIAEKNYTVGFDGSSDNDWQDYSITFDNPYRGFFVRLTFNFGDSYFLNTYSYKGRKKIKLPDPKLDIKHNLKNYTLEAGQYDNIYLDLLNNGKGKAESVYLKISSTNPNILSFKNSYYIGDIPSNTSKKFNISLSVNENIYSESSAKLKFILEEKDGFEANETVDITVTPKKPLLPANLFVPKYSIKFLDNNNVLEASENASIKMKLFNQGKGEAIGTKLKISNEYSDGVYIESQRNIGNLQAGGEKDIIIPIKTNYNTKDGVLKLKIVFEEANGFNSEPVYVEIPTAKFRPPEVLVTDFVISTSSSNMPKLGEPIGLKFSVQNIGQTSANNVLINCSVPDNVFFSTSNTFKINELKSNELKVFEVEFFANKLYLEKEIPVRIDIDESFGKYATGKLANIKLNATNSLTTVTLNGQIETKNINITGIRADVDINIPENRIKAKNTYALIIGNEDYSSKQNNLDKEIDVIYAKNDAIIFKEYLTKVYGVPDNNIDLLINATATEIKQGLDKLGKIVSLVGAKSDFIIFYAGHGISDNITKSPYIIPVDVNASNLEYALGLKEFTKIFQDSEVNQATILLDACFSGLGRNQSLIETRGFRVEPKYSNLSENTIIISSSSDIEPSHPYKEKNHGLFTYFLLKKLMETKGDVSINDLFDYLKENVTIQSILIKNTKQTPKIIVGSKLEENLDTIKLVNEK